LKILYFYQNFSTPQGAWGTRVYEFAKEWVKKGHEVTVVTAVYSKSDIKPRKFLDTQNCEGIQLKIINVKIDNKQPFYKRIWSFLMVALFSSYYALALKTDIVIASSGPITVGIPGLLAKYIRRRKLVFEVRDLWPEGAIELGIIKNKWIKKFTYWLEKKCYRASSFIITLSPGMTQNIKERFGFSNIEDVTNAANLELFSRKSEFNDPCLNAKEYAIYTGNIGEVNNSFWLFNAARELKNLGREDVKILMIGDGQQKDELEELKNKEEISNFLIYGLMAKEKLVPYIQHAFVSLVPLKGTPVLDTSSPNKFFESLAAGVPVIQNTNGWMKEFLETNAVGFTLPPGDPSLLAKFLIEMKDNQEKFLSMNNRCFLVANENFEKNYLAQKMLNCLLKVHH